MSSIVSHLPGALLDIVISIPYFLLSTHKALSRNRASAASASASAPASASSSVIVPDLPSAPAPTPPEAPATVEKETTDSPPSSEPEPEPEREVSENGSEADVESNDGVGGVSESWVSLRPDSGPTTAASPLVETTTA